MREVLEMEADRMIHLRLDQENLDNEKRIVTEELRAGTENDPMTRVQLAALKGVLREHPYAVDPVGTKEDIAAVKPRDGYATSTRATTSRATHTSSWSGRWTATRS